MLVAVVFVAETVPSFGPLLDFIGGSSLGLTSLVFPCLFYLFLSAHEKKAREQLTMKNGVLRPLEGSSYTLYPSNEQSEWPSVVEVLLRTDRLTLFCCSFVVVFGVAGGMAATFSAVREMSYAKFTLPCYVTAFMPEADEPNTGGHTNCCGHFQNVSRYGLPAEDYCNPYDGGFYS
jgi:solute carrier family 32 (vesicular inhibitory amino acid transporter)